ncbi:MAG: sugar phosphate isomerase/epimerase family protein [Candidatus Merdivicinus sp.]|jgi:sugar phosphate isomerase/epimerase
MIFGISTSCFYPLHTEDAARHLAEAGIPAAEVFFNAPSELNPDYLRELKKILNDGGTQIVSVHPFTCGLEPLLFFSEYQRRFWDGIQWYRSYFAAASILGAKYFILHGDRKEAETSDSLYFERFAGLNAAAAEYGIQVAQENVARCKSGSLTFLKKMKDFLPDTVFALDLKQARRAGEDWQEIYSVLGSNVRHIHLSGCSDTEDCLPVTRGNFDCLHFLRTLQNGGFDGAILLELYRGNYGDYSELYDCWKKMENYAAIS